LPRVLLFLRLKLPCSNHPRMSPTDRIKNMNNDLDIDSVQNKNLSSITVTFWIMNKPVVAARIMPIMSLTFMSIPHC
jgi:hypothetical protein